MYWRHLVVKIALLLKLIWHPKQGKTKLTDTSIGQFVKSETFAESIPKIFFQKKRVVSLKLG